MAKNSLVSIYGIPNVKLEKTFSSIDNYIYLYHTNTLIALPLYPESVQDILSSNFSESPMLSRSAPIYSYSNSGPRTLQFEFPLHRDMVNDINMKSSRFSRKLAPNIEDEDYVDIMIKQLQSAAVPVYAASEKMVNPPIVAIRIGNDLFCKGVIQGGVSATHHGPILRTGKYSCVNVSFNIHEVTPFDANSIMLQGGLRGLSKTLERNIWK